MLPCRVKKSRNAIIEIYTTILRHIVTNGSKGWVMAAKEEGSLLRWERKTYGAVREEERQVQNCRQFLGRWIL